MIGRFPALLPLPILLPGANALRNEILVPLLFAHPADPLVQPATMRDGPMLFR
jgi:hypothetical protein